MKKANNNLNSLTMSNCKIEAARGNLFTNIHRRLSLLPGLQGLNGMTQIVDTSQVSGQDGATPLQVIRREAEGIAVFIVKDALFQADKRPPNRYCKVMRKTVSELSERHAVLFNSMVQKLNISEDSAFMTFVNVADEIFMDGKISWGRIVAVYAFTAHFSKYCERNNMIGYPDRIALYAGKYVGNKLGHWLLDNGGWEAFSDYFDASSGSEGLWKGLLFTAALGTLAVGVVATR